ncbi:hypothetical protein ABK040_008341 [Willaertia magna]
MLPLTLLKGAIGSTMLVELKNGETFNGTLSSCDQFMNMNLEDVTCTSRDGTRFWKMDKVYIRGYTLKYIRILDEIINKVKEEQKKSRSKNVRGRGRGTNLNTSTTSTPSTPGRGRGAHKYNKQQ